MKTPIIFSVVLIIVLLLPAFLMAFTIERQIAEERLLLERFLAENERLQEIAEQRRQVLAYQAAGNTFAISTLFTEKANQLNRAYRSSNLDRVYDYHEQIKGIFRNIDAVKDQFLFYDGLYDYLIGDTERTKAKMEQLVNDFPNSSLVKQGYNFLTTIYIFFDHNEEYISLYERYPNFASAKHNYWLGQANYNLGYYARAGHIFDTLVNDPEYGFRAKIMQALILHANSGTYAAINRLNDLLESQNENHPYYRFLLISLARLYSLVDENEASIAAFERYHRLKKGDLPADEKFEGALIANRAGRHNFAYRLLFDIIWDEDARELFDKALTQIAMIQLEQEQSDSSKQLLRDALGSATAFTEMVEKMRGLVDEYKQRVANYLQTPGTSKQSLRGEIDLIPRQMTELERRQQRIDKVGMDEKNLTHIHRVSEEYTRLLRTLVESDEIARRVALQPNSQRVAQIDRRITEIDEMRVNLLSLKLLSNSIRDNTSDWNRFFRTDQFGNRRSVRGEAGQVMTNSYNIAYRIAEQLVSAQNELAELSDRDSGSRRGDIEQQIKDLYSEANFLFGAVDTYHEQVLEIQTELDHLSETRLGLARIRNEAARSYNQRLAEHIIRQNRDSMDESEFIYDFNQQLMSYVTGRLNDMSQEYQFAMIDILFRESLKREQEFRKMREAFEEERADSGGGK